MSEISTNTKLAQHKRSRGLAVRLKKQWELQIMVIPALILVFIFSYIPMYGVLMAFQDYSIFDGFWASPWVGLKHFEMFFLHLISGRL